MSSGISRDAAISSIIDENARQAGVSPEDYRTTWGDKGVNVYNRVAPKDRTPKMVEAYNSYTSSKKNFSTMRSMYKDFGLDDVKIDAVGVPIKYNGKDLVLSKSDITDLAIYSQGEASTFGTLVGVDPTVRLRSKQALARLKSKGLEDVADQIMRTVTSVPKYSKEPITGIMRGLRQGISNIIPEMSTSDQAIVASSVGMVLDKLNSSEYMDGLTSRVAAIQNKYGILPNRKGKLLTGDSETDKQTVYDIRRIAGAYNSGQRMNMSGDFSGFLENLPTSNKLDEIGLEYQVTLDANSNPLVEVVLYDNKGERAGGMTLQPDEAYNNFGININNLYEPPTVSLLKNYISSKGNKTSDGPVNEKSTYRSGDSYFQKEDFPNLSNLNDVDVQVNYEKFNGKYFPYVYVNNGKVDNIVPLSGMEDLNSSLSGLQSIMGPDFIQKVLNAAK
jgi:hypothetical protein